MKKIGLIGGIGPESTVDYYQLIINAFHEQQTVSGYPEVIIYSANLADLMQILESRDWNRLIEWLLERVVALHKAGAEFAAIGSNTPHVVFDAVSARSPVPMVSIVEATRAHAQKGGHRKLGLLGTRFTMESDFFQKSFGELDITIVVPEKDDRQLIHHRLFSEIELGIIKDATRGELLAIVQKMIRKHAIDALILGCTELPLILSKDEFGIPFLNTTAIHAQRIVNVCLGEDM